jgi:CheY-like chemotaxis protein
MLAQKRLQSSCGDDVHRLPVNSVMDSRACICVRVPQIAIPPRAPSYPCLIIDDDRETRTMLATMLTVHGYAVQTASDGAEGLSLLCKQAPKLILLDLKMPRMSGTEFCEAQQRLPKNFADVPVVIMDDVDAVNDERLRRLRVIPKPINRRALLAIIRRICGTPAV